MERSYATVNSAKAEQYAAQLCKHFGHRREAWYRDGEGRIAFDLGECRLKASPNELRLDISAETAESLTKTQDVVERHLKRFAWREEMQVDWRSV